ncbi:Efflux transporter, RND family, MFP subunit, AcrA/E family [uncultured Gammaproteobacteria bacterium]|jgi:multidrug efflux pump subunit AcrA (membrane-fusion protein)|nr:Efflux transporter, RND family, MFP subunit, AcrA/E family [Bathymodiolus brooksi thiotrophic gill symbiont]CAC9544586.1 Efflux transporter, RND family, MFP subunit, AcrA/E family [uncultured Gammaproteobacteria bacterium]CAC9559793.1 Efflux transporter, RND family, MFP subunit, AcrA/E family [uncultured Gammaproteobacteria bacterium]CAC9562727.1 Efflux transporter, RND family, MFP subunit, AcrA/E family [uncultured Gammaproteobacteria bacterium]CAC9566229.1 Efflux transporter, RND family, M
MSLLATVLTTLILLPLSLPSVAQFKQDSKSFSSTYGIQIVKGMSLNKRALLGGKVISSAQVSLSAQVSGDVLSIKGQEGDVFRKGAILIILEQESIQAQRDAVYAEIESANESLKNAGVQYSQSIVSPNSSSMFGGIPSMFSAFTDPMVRMSGQGNPDFDKFARRTSRYTSYQQAKHKLTQAKLKLKQVEARLKDANIVAPFDGAIVVKNVDQGDIVQPGQELIKFANIKKLQVELNVPSRLVTSLRLNKKYRIKLDMANIVVNAKLSQIYPIADNNKHSVKVKFDLPENSPVLAGAYAEVEIFETNSGSLMPIIPETAIIWRSSLPSVFVVNSQTNKTELRFVRLGEQVNDYQKSVLSGLEIGEKIVTNPNIMMISGMDT